jgi:hypothetical protein
MCLVIAILLNRQLIKLHLLPGGTAEVLFGSGSETAEETSAMSSGRGEKSDYSILQMPAR